MSGHPVHHHHRHHHHHPNSSQAFSPYPPPPPPPQNQTSNSNTTVTTTSNPNHLHHSNHRSSIPTSQPSSSAPLPTPPPPPPPSSSNTSSLRHGSLQISLPPPPPPPPTSSSSISTHHHHHHHSSQQSSHPSNHQQQHQPTSTHQSNSLNQSSNPSYLHPQHSSHQSHSNLQSNLHHPQSHLHHHPSHSRDHHQPIREFHSLHPSHSHSNLGSQRDQRIDHSNHHHHHHHHHRDRESQREPIQTRSHHPYISLSSQSEPLNRDQQHQITNRESHSHPPPQSSQPTLPHHHPSHSHNHSSSISNHHPTSHSSSAHHHHHHPHPPPPTSPSGHHSPHAPLQSASHTHPSAAVLNLPSQSQPLSHHVVNTNGSSLAHPPSHLPSRSPSSQSTMPPTLAINNNNAGSSSRQLAQPPPQSISTNGNCPDEDATVAAILRDGELNLQEQAADWHPPTNPSIKELVQEIQSGLITGGGACETLGEYNRAVNCYERALKYNPLNGTALTKAAGIYRHQENFKAAAKYFSRLLKIHESNGEIWGALGHCYLMIDELPRAYTSYQQALHHSPSPKSEPKLWYGIGILYDRYGSLEHAEEAFSSVIKMDPYFEKANEIYFRLGIIYKQQRKANLSLECFQWILDKPPSPLTEIDIWFQIGHVHEQQGNFDRAKEAYERVLAENPTHAKVLQQLGGLYCREGASFYDPHEAIVILNRSRSVDSNDPFTWYLLGRVAMIIQDYHKAYESYQQAVYREGKNPAFWCSIGVLYYAISQFHDSLDAYSRAIRINPFLSEVWFNLGALYESCKDQMLDAIDAYSRAIQLDSNNAHIHRRLEEIKLHQETGAPLSPPPSPKDMSYTSANWPFPNAFNGPSDLGFGLTPNQAAHDEPNHNNNNNNNHQNTIIHSPKSPVDNLVGPISPIDPSTRNIHRPSTSNSNLTTRPQSAGSSTHPHHSSSSISHHNNQIHLIHHYTHSSSLTRSQSGGHGSLAPMEFEPSPKLNNNPSTSHHNLPHIRAIVESQSRTSSPTPTSIESNRRNQTLPVSRPREILSPHTSPSIRTNLSTNDRVQYSEQISSTHSNSSIHIIPPPPPPPSSTYSRFSTSNLSNQDPLPNHSHHQGHLSGLLNSDRDKDKPTRQLTRFKSQPSDSRSISTTDRDVKIPSSNNPNLHSSRNIDQIGSSSILNNSSQTQLQSPYNNRYHSPGLRLGSNIPRNFSPENTHSPTWSTPLDHRSNLLPLTSINTLTFDHQRPHSRTSQSFQPNSNISTGQITPSSSRYDPRHDESMILDHKKCISVEQVSPQKPKSDLQQPNEQEIEQEKTLNNTRLIQPSSTSSLIPSEFALSTGNGSNINRRPIRNKTINKDDEYSSNPIVRKRKNPMSRLNNNVNTIIPPTTTSGINNSISTSSIQSPIPLSPSSITTNETSQNQSINKEKKEKKKIAITKVRGVIKTKINDHSTKTSSPSPVSFTLPTTNSESNQNSQINLETKTTFLPNRKVDETFEEYDEVADTLLSFATQPSCRVMTCQKSSHESSSHSIPTNSNLNQIGISNSSQTQFTDLNNVLIGNDPVSCSSEDEKSSIGQLNNSASVHSPSNSSNSIPLLPPSNIASPKQIDSSPESTLIQTHSNQSNHYIQHSGQSSYLKRNRSDESSSMAGDSGPEIKKSRANEKLSPVSLSNRDSQSPSSTNDNNHGKINAMSITGGKNGIMNDDCIKLEDNLYNGGDFDQNFRKIKKGSFRNISQKIVKEDQDQELEEDRKSNNYESFEDQDDSSNKLVINDNQADEEDDDVEDDEDDEESNIEEGQDEEDKEDGDVKMGTVAA
ncbi:hypothetical protein O181_041153 [Austropuccinia psidii MF-1]|uniref:Uncharacterized protein n=1 Tax=Austropuccinia psidii MF-1 TaxID=1389203 RepID=A0A9Q3DGU7_9BASI|nr:hypothetical protein [Austropuccinia psidii MF-1]